jgi:hypothetical protein
MFRSVAMMTGLLDMENSEIEIWTAGKGYFFVYTTYWEYAKILRKMKCVLTTYEFRGKVFASQTLLTSRELGQFKAEIWLKNRVETKQLTAA